MPLPISPSVGTEVPRAAERTAPAECRLQRSRRFPRPIRSHQRLMPPPIRGGIIITYTEVVPNFHYNGVGDIYSSTISQLTKMCIWRRMESIS